MDTLGNIAKLLLVREDLDEELSDKLEALIVDVKKIDIIERYIDGIPYNNILGMIKMRRKAKTVTNNSDIQ